MILRGQRALAGSRPVSSQMAGVRQRRASVLLPKMRRDGHLLPSETSYSGLYGSVLAYRLPPPHVIPASQQLRAWIPGWRRQAEDTRRAGAGLVPPTREP